MKESFLEESSVNAKYKQDLLKYKLLTLFAVLSFVCCVLWFFSYFLFFIEHISGKLWFYILILVTPIIILVTIGCLFLKTRNNFCVDYDYTFVSGTVKIAKVINNKKRKLLLKFETSDILKVGKIDSKFFEKILTTPLVSFCFYSANEEPDEGKDFYYFYISVNGEKKVVVIECSKKFFVNFFNYINKTIIDEEFK